MIDSLFSAFLYNPFLQMALLAGFAASITSGILGCYVVAKRIVFITGSIAHSVLGGMGVFLWIRRTFHYAWLSPLYGALLAAIGSALAIAWVRSRFKDREDTIIAALWSTGMSIGVLFIALTPGYNVELMHFLFGNILWSDPSDILTLLLLDLVVILCIVFFHSRFLLVCFDPEQAYLRGISVEKTYALLLCLIAISIVVLIEVVGAILIISMLAIPAAIAGMFTHHLLRMMGLAVILGWGLSFFGITIAYQMNWPPGATIALLSTCIYLGALFRKNRARACSSCQPSLQKISH